METPVQRRLGSWPSSALHKRALQLQLRASPATTFIMGYMPLHTPQPLPPMAASVLTLLQVEDDWGFRGEDLASCSCSSVAGGADILLTIN